MGRRPPNPATLESRSVPTFARMRGDTSQRIWERARSPCPTPRRWWRTQGLTMSMLVSCPRDWDSDRQVVKRRRANVHGAMHISRFSKSHFAEPPLCFCQRGGGTLKAQVGVAQGDHYIVVSVNMPQGRFAGRYGDIPLRGPKTMTISSCSPFPLSRRPYLKLLIIATFTTTFPRARSMLLPSRV